MKINMQNYNQKIILVKNKIKNSQALDFGRCGFFYNFPFSDIEKI